MHAALRKVASSFFTRHPPRPTQHFAPMQFFDGCTALITGASSGFGREFAQQLAPFAGTLILVARRADRLEELKADLARAGLTIHCHAVDLADETQTENFLATLAAGSERVSLLINNAGCGDHGLFEDAGERRGDVTARHRLQSAVARNLVGNREHQNRGQCDCSPDHSSTPPGLAKRGQPPCEPVNDPALGVLPELQA